MLSMISDEVMNNIISYALTQTEDPLMEAELALSGDLAVLRFSDNGPVFDPLQKGPADTETDPLERPAGGMGIHLVRQFSDSAEYIRRDGRNILTLTKKLC